jgi:hypothetical protein
MEERGIPKAKEKVNEKPRQEKRKKKKGEKQDGDGTLRGFWSNSMRT